MTDSSETQDIVETTATENPSVESQEIKEWGQESEAEKAQESEQQEQEQEKPKKNRAQERIEQLARENAELRQFKANQEAQAQQPKPTGRPNIADYEDVEDYYKAVDDYQIDQAMQRFESKQSQSTQQQKQIEAQIGFQTAIDELAEEGIDYATYAQKANELPSLPVTLDQFGLSPKDTLLLAKTLIDDTDTYIELSQMSAVQAAAKIGQMIAKPVSKAPAISKAPPPIKPTKANASVTRSTESMSDDEWYKAEIQKRKGK